MQKTKQKLQFRFFTYTYIFILYENCLNLKDFQFVSLKERRKESFLKPRGNAQRLQSAKLSHKTDSPAFYNNNNNNTYIYIYIKS